MQPFCSLLITSYYGQRRPIDNGQKATVGARLNAEFGKTSLQIVTTQALHTQKPAKNMTFNKLIATTLLASSLLTLVVQAGTVTYYNAEDPAQNHGSSNALGSCGAVLTSGVPSGAINDAAWGSPNCGRIIAVRNDATGACIEVPVLDRCASCAPDHVDLTVAGFNALFDPSVGVGQGSWSFGTCESAPAAPPPVPDARAAPVQEVHANPAPAQEDPVGIAAPAIPNKVDAPQQAIPVAASPVTMPVTKPVDATPISQPTQPEAQAGLGACRSRGGWFHHLCAPQQGASLAYPNWSISRHCFEA